MARVRPSAPPSPADVQPPTAHPTASQKPKSEEVKGTAADAKKNAAALGQSIAALLAQAEESYAEQKRIEAKHATAGAGTPVPDVKHRVNHPALAYGYDGYDGEGGALKKWMEPIREAVPKMATQKKAAEDTKTQVEEKIRQATADEAKAKQAYEDAVAAHTRLASDAKPAGGPANQALEKIGGEYKRIYSKAANLDEDEKEFNQLKLSLLATSQAKINAMVESEKKSGTKRPRAWIDQVLEQAKLDAAEESKKANQPVIDAEQAEAKAKQQYDQAVKDLAAARAILIPTIPSGTAAEAKLLSFEQEMKDMQNAWMRGEPVDPEAMKSKVAELKKALASPEAKDLLPADAKEKIDKQLDDFPAKIDQEVKKLEDKIRGQVSTNRTFGIAEDIVKQRVFYAKLERFEKQSEKGLCDWLHVDSAPKNANSVVLNASSKRAYLLVGPEEAQSLYYVNQNTGECREVCAAGSEEMQAILREIEAGDQYTSLSRLGQKVIHPLTMRPLSTPPSESESKSTHPDAAAGALLTTLQEERIRKLADHVRRPEDIKSDKLELKEVGDVAEPSTKPYIPHVTDQIDSKTDWKQVLPIAVRTDEDLAREEQQRRNEAADKKIGPDNAYANAVKRLQEQMAKAGDCEYDCQGERFKLGSTKNKDGTVFTITPVGKGWTDTFRSDYIPQAMAKMIEICHLANPDQNVKLSCQEMGPMGVYAKRMVHELEHAIRAAEKNAEKGIYIGIELDENLKKAIIDATKAGVKDTNLVLRANKLCELAEKHRAKKMEAVTSKVGKSSLGDLLETPLPGMSLGGGRQEIDKVLEGKTPEEQSKMVEKEVKKLEFRAKQADMQNANIKNELKAIEEKMELAGITQEELTELSKSVERLREAQNEVNREYKKLGGYTDAAAGVDEKGLATHYASWMRSFAPEMGAPDDKDGAGQQFMNVINTPVADDSKLSKEAKGYVAHVRRTREVDAIGDRAKQAFAESKGATPGGINNLSKIEELSKNLQARIDAAAPAPALPSSPRSPGR